MTGRRQRCPSLGVPFVSRVSLSLFAQSQADGREYDALSLTRLGKLSPAPNPPVARGGLAPAGGAPGEAARRRRPPPPTPGGPGVRPAGSADHAVKLALDSGARVTASECRRQSELVWTLHFAWADGSVRIERGEAAGKPP